MFRGFNLGYGIGLIMCVVLAVIAYNLGLV